MDSSGKSHELGVLTEAQLDSIRHQLAVLSTTRKTRREVFTPERPSKWSPTQVIDPTTAQPFTIDGAWQFVADCINSGHPISTKILDKPPGKRAYVMIVKLENGRPDLYIKLELGSGVVFGRSFHYCRYEKTTSERAQ